MGIIGIHGKKYFNETQSSPIAIAQQAAVTGKRIFVTDIAGSSDLLGAVLQVREGEVTVKFAVQLHAVSGSPMAFSHSFVSPIIGASGTPMEVYVDGDVTAKANISGFIV